MATIKQSGLWRHPKTGMMWLRKVVPAHLRDHVGQREFRLTLGTKNIAEAKARYPEVAARVQRKLDWGQQLYDAAREMSLEAGEQEAHEQRIEDWLNEHLMPEQRDVWERWRSGEELDGYRDELVFRTLPAWAFRLDKLPWEPDEPVATPVDRPAEQQADDRNPTVSLRRLLDWWFADTRASSRTRYTWGLALDQFARWLGHGNATALDASKVTKRDVIRYKDYLVAEGQKPNTITLSLNTIRAVYSNALNNERLPGVTVNPAQGVRVVAKESQTEQRRGYTEAEARAALEAVAGHSDPAVRYLPPLMFWTGMRLEDACGIRCRDVRLIEGAGWCVDVVPHVDRTLKTNASRMVPLHAALGEFIEFAQQRQANAKDLNELLFNTITPDTHGKLAPNIGKRIAKAIRPAVEDPNVAPSHSFRHAIVTRLRAIGCPEDIRKVITGHAAGDIHGRYGDAAPAVVLRKWIDRLPELSGVSAAL
jgi:integrase